MLRPNFKIPILLKHNIPKVQQKSSKNLKKSEVIQTNILAVNQLFIMPYLSFLFRPINLVVLKNMKQTQEQAYTLRSTKVNRT